MGTFTGISSATLSTWLTEAQEAYHALNTGQQVVSIRTSDGKAMSFTAATADRLLQYIRELQVALAIASGQPDPRSRPAVATWTR